MNNAGTATIPLSEYNKLKDVFEAQARANQGTTRVSLVLDRSGSVSTVIDDLIGGVNTFLAERKEDTSPQAISILLFDDQIEYAYRNAEPKDVQLFNRSTYVPRGMTALFDAIGRGIAELDAAMQKNDRALLLIATDGQENSSREFTATKIKQLIAERQKSGSNWTIVFVGAGVDAYNVGVGMGVHAGNTVAYNPSHEGTRVLWGTVSRSTTNYAASGAGTMDSFFGGLGESKTIIGAEDEPLDLNDAIVAGSGFKASIINLNKKKKAARTPSAALVE